jgi:hypothetical protein
MIEFYIETNSFAAPMFSDNGHCYVTAPNVADALEKCRTEYRHPCGLYAAAAYSSADARKKGETPIARWICNQAKALENATMLFVHKPGDAEIDGVRMQIEDPKGGKVYYD